MTLRQTVLKTFYPVIMKAGKWFGIKTAIERNNDHVKPLESFYDLTATANDSAAVNFNDFKGKKVMLVNIASDCGYTEQLAELQKLHELHKDRLIIMGFPANDFKEQEKGTDAEIASFCEMNYGVQFILMKKSIVVQSAQQNQVYKWLSDKRKNGWNDKVPEWNFSKYLVNEEGVLTHYFGPAISPIANDIQQHL